MASSGAVRARARRVGGFATLPWRRIILIILGATISFVIVVGSYRTLTLPEAERYSGDFWVDQVVNGIGQGAILALIALGYTLVYGILRMINFAHGEVFMAGAFISFFFADAYVKSGFLNSNPYLSLLILFAVSIVGSTVVAVLLERIAYRPLRNAPRLVPLITAIGASLFIQNAFRGFFGPQPYGYPLPDVLAGSVELLGIPVSKVIVLVFVVAIVSMVVLQLFVHRSRTGRSMRAVAEDSEIASLMGIDVDRIVVVTFVVGGVLAGVAGVLFSLTFQQVQFTMGFKPGIAAFTAAVLGGIGSIGGAALGGFVLGLLQAIGPPLLLTGFSIPSPFSIRDAFVFLVLILVLVFRPGGLLGSGDAEKV
ncbi:MAG TPA: branched-chain amino acid ABC transporter permease [Actinomycetota bacterium]|nr:branched-chain amino acid ABC transporter permease [Actinomycetota bacterium]